MYFKSENLASSGNSLINVNRTYKIKNGLADQKGKWVESESVWKGKKTLISETKYFKFQEMDGYSDNCQKHFTYSSMFFRSLLKKEYGNK